MTFCFKCPECGYRVETTVREPAPTHFHSWKPGAKKNPQPRREVSMIRDYRAESSNVWTFTNALGEGKSEARTVKPEDDVSRTGPLIGG